MASSLSVSRYLPSGEKAIDSTDDGNAARLRTTAPVATSSSWPVQDTRYLLSGEKKRLPWGKIRSCWPVVASQSHAPVVLPGTSAALFATMYLPSGEKAASATTGCVMVRTTLPLATSKTLAPASASSLRTTNLPSGEKTVFCQAWPPGNV